MDCIFPLALEQATDRAIELLERTPFVPGQLFYTQQALADVLQITPALSAAVLDQLVYLGHVERREGAYLVIPPKLVRNIWDMSSLSEAMAGRGLRLTSQILSFEITEAPKAASTLLGLLLGERVYCLHRLRFIDGVPTVIELSYLPVSFFPGLMEYDFGQNSLYRVLKDRYGVHAENQAVEIFIETPSPEEANYLDVSPGEPLLVLSGKTLTKSGRAFEYSVSKSPACRTCYECSPTLKGLF